MKTPEWTTAGGDAIPLSEMSTKHIQNVLIYIARGTGEHGPLTRPGCAGFSTGEWVALCRAELTRRSRTGRL
jgi:hypothetical protein